MGEKFGLLAITAIVFAVEVAAQAETLSGTVVDPQQHVVVDAIVSLVCGKHTDTHKTNGEGEFNFIKQVFPASCRIRAVYPNFAALELPVGRRRTFILQLQIAEQEQTVSVAADRLSRAPLDSVSLSDAELRAISNNSDDLIAYAKQVAGVYSGADALYVDGMPAGQLPPADRIGNITVNADPFSAEYSDAGDAHIDITTKPAERKFRITSAGGSLGTRAPNGLNPSLGSTTDTAMLGITGPVPRLPLAFTGNINYVDDVIEQPIEADVPSLQASPIAAASSVTSTGENFLYALGADYARKENLSVNAELYVATLSRTNMGAGGMTLPEAGAGQNLTVHEFRATVTQTTKHFVSRGGISVVWANSKVTANSGALGVNVSGAFIAGGAATNQQSTPWTRWTLKDVVQSHWKNHLWSAGATLTRRGDAENIIPNAYGQIYFNNLADYILSATTGAPNGTKIVMQGQGNAAYASYFAAPFIEAELLRRKRVVVRGGVRADAQTAGGVLVSPRLSVVADAHGFILRAGSGMFVKPWTNAIFLHVIEDDGNHLNQYLTTNAAFSGIATGTTTAQSEIVAKILPNFVPIRDWTSRISVEHPFKNFSPGIEYTWTDGTHLLGSQRLSAPVGASAGWIDWLGSNRVRQEHQIHIRALYKILGQSLTAHYEWIHSRDNTDGPFSFPAVQNNIRGEWGPTSGLAAHNLTFVANSRLGPAFSLTVVESWHSPLPLNITSGLDPEGNGLYTDRAGLPRNSGSGTDYNLMDAYLYRRLAIPKFLLRFNRRTYLNCNMQVLNLLNNQDYSSFGTVLGSPLLGQPLAAAPGRSYQFSFSFSH
ncbi:MAG: hypothetical protein ACYCPS_05575 [Candidatus Saccharimonadales bacterium]